MKRTTLAILTLLAATAALGQSAPSLTALLNSSTNGVTLYWDAVPGATFYDVKRTSSGYPAWDHVVRVNIAVAGDQLNANSAYVYRIYPVDNAGNPVGPPSNTALVSTFVYTDETIVPGSTPVKPVHVTELRTSINAIRAACGLGAQSWTNNVVSNAPIKRQDITDLRTGLDGAFSTIGLTLPAYVDPVIDDTVRVARDHIQQLRQRGRTTPEKLNAVLTLSNRYFSPNGDGTQDTTALTIVVGSYPFSLRTDFRWLLNLRSVSSGLVVRSFSGSGGSFVYTWDGRNDSGVMQPDGDYRFELLDRDGTSVPLVTALTTLDVTSPAVAFTSPAPNSFVGNVRFNGSTSYDVKATASDANLASWTFDQTGNALPDANQSTGTLPLTSANTLVWRTAGVPNGNYTLKLTATDRAGNRGTATLPLTLGSFSASANVFQINAADSEQVTYTSIVPETLTEVLTIYSKKTLQPVRTLVNVQRAAGTYTDVWDARDNGGTVVGDGSYYYLATANDGIGSMTWDQSTSYIGTTATQYEYPKCRNSLNALVDCNSSTLTFDPYANKPLRINYCAGTGNPPSCSAGSTPFQVTIKATPPGETDYGCTGNNCILQEEQPAGAHEVLWYGTSVSSQFIANNGGLTVIRRNDNFPRNRVLVYGTAPVVSNLTITPLMFNPAAGTTLYPNGMKFALDATSSFGRTITIKGEFRNLESNSTLRTVTTAATAAGAQALYWDGLSDSGEWVAPGTYEATLTISDSAGSATVLKPLITIRY